MNQDDVLRDALAGIKAKRIRKRISRFKQEDGLLFEVDEGKAYVPGKGIVHAREINEKILDCNHSSAFGLGHIADCGHAVCMLCVQRFILECADCNCFKKLCTVRGCHCSAKNVEWVHYCKRHYLKHAIDSWFFLVFMNRAWNGERIKAIYETYCSRRIRLHERDEEKRESDNRAPKAPEKAREAQR